MLECEIKLFNIDKLDIEATMHRIGAEMKYEDLLVDIYLKSPGSKQVRSRVRCTEKKTMLTCKYKLPVTTTKQAYEFDTILPYDFIIDSNSRSGLVDHVRIKKRTSYSRGGYNFDIDEYRGTPPLLEIEGPDETSIQKVIILLGRQKYTQATCGGKGVYSFYTVPHPVVTSEFVGRLLSLIRCL